MLMARNGDTEKCWKQYKRLIKLLAVLVEGIEIMEEDVFLLKVTLNGVIRDHSVQR